MHFLSLIWPGAPRPAPVPLTFAGNLPGNHPGNLGATVAEPAAGRPRPAPAGKPRGKRRGKRSPARQASPPSPHRALVTALGDDLAWYTVSALADRMGCCVGEASKRVKAAAAAGLVATCREGRCKYVTLRYLRPAQRAAILGEARP